MAQLAILGHETRGEEVIEILEMLGGKNDNHCCGGFLNSIYFINNYRYIESCDRMQHLDYLQLTLEEFLEKYPYKVGDNAYNIIHNENQTITKVAWSFQEKEVIYQTNDNEWVFVNYLQPYKEETMEENETMNEDKGTLVAIDLTQEIKKANEIEVILGDYEFVLKDGKTYFVKKNKYPKTYEECCGVLKIPNDERYIDIDVPLDYNKVLSAFTKLLICRDAYWKIAGDWKFDFDSEIYYNCNEYGEIQKSKGTTDYNVILAFPTEEMRDAFYEYFKDLIESCKELL